MSTIVAAPAAYSAPRVPEAAPVDEAAELSDADLEHVVGGLTRPWMGASDAPTLPLFPLTGAPTALS